MRKLSVLLCLSFGILWLPADLRATTAEAKDYEDIGMAVYRSGLYSKAVEYFQKAVEADPADWQAYAEMGAAYEKMGNDQEALDAYQKSLNLHPDNPTLRITMENLEETSGLSPRVEETQTAPPESSEGTGEKTVVVKKVRRGPFRREIRTLTFDDDFSPTDHARMWYDLELGYDYSTQDELMAGATALNSQIASNGWSGTASAGNSGLMAGGEVGFLLDLYNGLGIGIRRIQPLSYQADVNFEPGNPSPDFEDLKLDSAVWPITLDYFRFFPDPTGRFFINAGLGYYGGTLHVTESYSFANLGGPADSLEGDLYSAALGFQVGFGREWTLTPSLGIRLFAHGRWAKLADFHGTVYNSTGGSADFTLVKFNDGTVDIDQTANLASDETPATIDFSGFDAGFAFTFYAY